MRRHLAAAFLSVSLLGVGAPGAAAQVAPTEGEPATTTTTSSTTTTTSSTTTSTTPPLTTPSTVSPGPTTPTSITVPTGGTTTTSSSTVPDPEDPVGGVDAAPEEVPLFPDTVPAAPATDGGALQGVIRRELKVARAEAIRTDLAARDAAARVDEASRRLGAVQRELAELDAAEHGTLIRLEEARRRFEDRVADAVVRGNVAQIETLVSSHDTAELMARRVMLQSVAEADDASVADYQAARATIDDGLLVAADKLSTSRRELRTARMDLQTALEANAALRYQLAVFVAGSEVVIDGFVFPVGEPHDFIDSFGFPRMTGTTYSHAHQGTDIMAPFGTPLYATERGIITKIGSDVLGGQKLWLKGQSGTYYYYAHLMAYAEGLHEGQLVEAGDVVGLVGDTGNAKGGAPHLHFEIHPGGGAAVNPYPLLKVVDDLSRA